jgi:hypothetical protein
MMALGEWLGKWEGMEAMEKWNRKGSVFDGGRARKGHRGRIKLYEVDWTFLDRMKKMDVRATLVVFVGVPRTWHDRTWHDLSMIEVYHGQIFKKEAIVGCHQFLWNFC